MTAALSANKINKSVGILRLKHKRYKQMSNYNALLKSSTGYRQKIKPWSKWWVMLEY